MSALAASPLVLDRTPRMMRLAPLATILMVASLSCEPYRASNDDSLASEIDVVGVGAGYLAFHGGG
jgi:hypothetical protein